MEPSKGECITAGGTVSPTVGFSGYSSLKVMYSQFSLIQARFPYKICADNRYSGNDEFRPTLSRWRISLSNAEGYRKK